MKLSKAVTFATTTTLTATTALTAYFFQFVVLRKPNAPAPDNTGTDWDKYIGFIKERKEWINTQKTEKLSITSFDGLKLCATFLPAKTQSNKFILAFHGYRSKGLNEFSAISYFYHNKGYNVLIVDDRAHGESEGKYIGFGCLDYKDCISWIKYIVNRFGEDIDIFLHGISMGASTVLMASGEDLPKCIKGIIADCGFTCPWDVFEHILKRDYHLPPFPLLPATSSLCKFLAGYGFRERSTIDQVSKTDIPILFIHGEKDTFVPTYMSKQNYKACSSEKELLIIEGAGHAESYYSSTKEYEEALNKFINKYE